MAEMFVFFWPCELQARFYCKCGDGVHYSGGPEGLTDSLLDFSQRHQGEGHGPCDATTALRARRKREGKGLKVEE